MLKKLILKNCFTHKDRVFDFQTGLISISGENESGKSLVLEMIRYALFGAKALRGKSSDLKGAEVDLTFEVKGQEYRVYRKNSVSKFFEGDVLMVNGTAPVNQRVEELFGYNLAVFDTANSCNQGAVEALGNMTPTQRKEMVDRTIGLDAFDTLVDEISANMKNLNTKLETLKTSLPPEVEEPQEPENYEPSETLRTKVVELREKSAEYNRALGSLQNVMEEPQVDADVLLGCVDTSEIEAHQKEKNRIDSRIDQIKSKLATVETTSHSSQELWDMKHQWDLKDEYDEYQKKFNQLPVPVELTVEQIGDLISQRRAYDAQEAMKEHMVTCPNCDHDFVPGHSPSDPIETPEFQMAELETLRRNRLQWDTFLQDNPTHPQEVSTPILSRKEIFAHEALVGNEVVIADLEKELSELTPLEDRSNELTEVVKRKAQKDEYMKAVERYNTWKETYEKSRELVASLEADVNSLPEYERRLDQAVVFENEQRVFLANSEQRSRIINEIADVEEAIDDEQLARKALKEMKVRIKNYLVPSLNTVASLLLSEMTGGKRTTVNVDPDFNILIDGQAINTLSGSGKAVANLAIRLGLGQVLTNKVFSVFMGDEIDASMDQNRAGFTAEAMKGLHKTISQVVLVSHKEVEADHHIHI